MNIKFFTVFGKWVTVALASASLNTETDIKDAIVDVTPEGEIVEKIDVFKEENNVQQEEKKSSSVTTESTPVEVKEPASDVISLDSNVDDKIIETFVGTITGYGPDCVGCSGEGYLACRAKDGSRYSLKYNDITYNDEEYGVVRILAAATTKFPCGTIINVVTPRGSFNGVVMDTGGSMRKAWNENNLVWIDLAFKTEADAETGMPKANNVTYNVLRYGWN